MECVRARASGRKSNDLRNWIKSKRKLRNRASPPYGRESLLWDVSAGAHTPGANEKHHRGNFPRLSLVILHLPLPPPPLPPLNHLFLSSRRPPIGYPSGWNQGFRFAFGACPLTERVSHSIRNNALSAKALFRNDSCCPRGCIVHTLIARAIIAFPLAELSVSSRAQRSSREIALSASEDGKFGEVALSLLSSLFHILWCYGINSRVAYIIDLRCNKLIWSYLVIEY